ncbi:TPA: hypothetical protein UL927_000515 [Stenotrophomonas maltophilia]|jgi:hypothetical protein|uniref:hypothetical protein n=1 Tax=Stenotrophomonas TaxID=40323 RepID=UPI000976253E|nr:MULTISPECIES: hypothetical protein [Stenotrophomonas]MCV4212861.1 hypothetical protein [Pseudomonas cichorii]MBA0239139.1 hypothetical protein [Stenotrophomonas maltophilia]MBA0259821.1 hypothetical protein [Stenotrophomonas maltophilia]MBB1135673.1 hypothetical protein [Stenotrophomonas sp. I18B00994]MBH1580416.1 hypothetical protein [Stenotrophomonas maltophilia]
MNTFYAGHFNVDIEITGDGPFVARGTLRPLWSQEPLRSVLGQGATEAEAVAAARELANAAATEMSLMERYRRYID